jgi:ribosome-binding factor A
MAREFARSRRVEEQIQRVLADVLRAELRDPRVAGVVITEVQASKDLSVAWVHYALLGTEEPAPDTLASVHSGLERAAGFLRSRLARELASRTVPELRFRHDEAAHRARSLEKLIDTAVAREGSTGTPPEADGEP